MPLKIATAALLIAPVACWAADQFDVRPGLWDMTTTVQMKGMPPMANLDQLPPERRARIEAMMKNMSGQSHTTKTCVTKEGIEKAIADANKSKNNACAPKITSMTSSRVVMHVDCTQENGAGSTNGDMTIERQDPEHIKGTGAWKMTGNGRSMDMNWSMNGTFVSPDCGNVKPSGQR